MSNGSGDETTLRITLRDVYVKQDQLTEMVTALSRSVDGLSGEMKGSMALLVVSADAAKEDIKDHEARIRLLERARWPIPSLAVLLSAASLVYAIMSGR